MLEDKLGQAKRLFTAGRAVLLISLIVSLLTSCVVSDENETPPDNTDTNNTGSGSPTAPEDGANSENVVASTTTSSTESGSEFRFDIHSINRQSDDVLALDMSMVNTNPAEDIYIPLPPEAGDAPSDYQHITLIDAQNKRKHLPLLYESGECYCANWNVRKLGSGESLRVWITFPAPPKKIDSLIFLTSTAPPIMDVPVNGSKNDKVKAPKTSLAEPRVMDIQEINEETDGDLTRKETPGEIAISLSSDVLFATNKATLNDSAMAQLEQVAREIEDAPGQVVQVDGHTDDTGTDSINDPLSEDRAEAVKDTLSKIVDNPKIEYEIAGHGSKTPIATNETEEGRTKNRRVTITFQK